MTSRRLAHIVRVVDLLDRWATTMNLDPAEAARWRRAGWLHDALRDAPEPLMGRWAGQADLPANLLHGPAAAACAAANGESDDGVLAAVRWHTIGSAGWDDVGKALYCADFLEPGRTQAVERRAVLAGRFPTDPRGVLREVAEWRARHHDQRGYELTPEGREFREWLGL